MGSNQTNPNIKSPTSDVFVSFCSQIRKWVEAELYKGDNDHDDAELPVKVRMHNCQEDRLALRLYEAALSDLLKRVERFLTHR